MINLKDGIKVQVIIGKFINYSELLADDGYCLYDKDERQYHTSVKTPITDVLVLDDKYVAVLGDADVINQEVAEMVGEENLKNEVNNV